METPKAWEPDTYNCPACGAELYRREYTNGGHTYDVRAEHVCSVDRREPERRKIMDLMNYETGLYLRQATAEELAASIEAATHDGGAGVIEVDGVRCYVIE